MTDNRTESYSIGLSMEDDMMLVNDTTEIQLPTSSSIAAAKQKRTSVKDRQQDWG